MPFLLLSRFSLIHSHIKSINLNRQSPVEYVCVRTAGSSWAWFWLCNWISGAYLDVILIKGLEKLRPGIDASFQMICRKLSHTRELDSSDRQRKLPGVESSLISFMYRHSSSCDDTISWSRL